MFLDIQMPGLTGLELAERASGQCHVVFVTAYDQYAVSAFEEGAVDYIMKPLSAGRLATACQRVKAGRCTGCRDSTKWVAPMSVTRHEKGEFVAYPLIFWDPPNPPVAGPLAFRSCYSAIGTVESHQWSNPAAGKRRRAEWTPEQP